MKPKPILPGILVIGMITLTQSQAGHAAAESDAPYCRRVEKHKLVERPRHHLVKEKVVVKDCCHVYKHLHKWVNGVLVKDHPHRHHRFCRKHHSA
ncbi:MAG: hypothetical protein KGS60_11940 [Verrucomicrobia bacterium]|nr:hypothetical protein [Verrucomicrobiota bacterium]